MMSKWTIFHKQNAVPKISAGEAIAARINTDLSIHLTTRKTKKDIKENHPQDLLNQAKDSIGKLSRIFEQMDWPIPDYEEISAEIEQVGLKAYTKTLLNNILPTLLDDTGTKLNQKVINAINFAGQSFTPPINNLYDEYCKRNFKEEIADQFAQAIIVGFTQKILDLEKAKSIKLMETEIEKLTDTFEGDVQDVLSESLSDKEENGELNQLRKTYQEAIKKQEDADRVRQKRLHEQFNTPMEALAKLTSTQGILPTLDVDNMEQAKEFIQAFDQLVAHANKANIEIPGLEKAEKELEMARNILDGSFDGLDEKTKVTKIGQNLVSAASKIIDAMNTKLEVCLPNPVENSLWQKFLNLFTTTKEMKIYNKQQELLNKLDQGYEMQYEQKSLLKVEFKEDSIKVHGLGSDNARARFLDKLNAGSNVDYKYDQDGNFNKVANGKNENLSEDDILHLKEKLKSMDDAQDSLYRIIQIEAEEPANSTQMRM